MNSEEPHSLSGVTYPFRVDVSPEEVEWGNQLHEGRGATVTKGRFNNTEVVLKRPRLRTRSEMERFHRHDEVEPLPEQICPFAFHIVASLVQCGRPE